MTTLGQGHTITFEPHQETTITALIVFFQLWSSSIYTLSLNTKIHPPFSDKMMKNEKSNQFKIKTFN